MRHILKLIPVLLIFLSLSLMLQAQTETVDDLDDILPLSADITYTVRGSDTLDGIGALFDVSPPCIAESNEIELRGGLSIGQQLLISVECPIYGADPTYNGQAFVENSRAGLRFDNTCDSTYRIRDAVNFAMAAMLLNVDEASLQETNAENSDGDCLEIAFGASPALDTPTDEEGQGGGSQIYVMRAGDTIDTIASRFDVATESILTANDISRSEARFLAAGTRLVIPTSAPVFGEVPASDPDFDPEQGGANAAYVVQPGDVLDSIAASANLELGCLVEANDISNAGEIFPGDVIILDSSCPPYRGLGAPIENFVTTTDESGGGSTDDASDEATETDDEDGEAQPLGG